ncbi:MAG: TolC family protein [Bacteroidales bacterium]|nr:TolC family protein [Bacteroidales bacterium]
MNTFHNCFFIVVVLALGLHQRMNSQEPPSFSLEEACRYAEEHNYEMKNARTDIDIAGKKVSETMAIGFPQVSASLSYNNFLDIPTTLIPDFLTPAIVGVNEGIFGLEPTVTVSDEVQFFEAKFGVQHNMTASATLNQLLFSGQYIVGLQASRAYLSLSETSMIKTGQVTRESVSKAYFPVVIIRENMKVLDSTLVSLRQMLSETQAIYRQGFIEDTDVDQLELMISDLEATISDMGNQYEIALGNLKFQMGIGMQTDIRITSDLEDLISGTDSGDLLVTDFDHRHHIDYRVFKNQEALAQLDLKLKRSEYLPTLNAFYSYQSNGMRDKFDFLDFDKEWYPSQVIGVQLDIPIFSSGSRKYKVQQARLQLDKVKVMDDQVREGLSLQLSSAKSAYSNAYKVHLNKSKGMDIARKIHQKTEAKYKAGMAGSLELSQTYNQFMNAEMEYLLATLDLLNRKAELEKLLTRVQ